MLTIKAPVRITDNFGDGFDKFFQILNLLNGTETGALITLDFSQSKTLNPFFLLPLFLSLKSKMTTNNIEINFGNPESEMSIYLKHICFESPLSGFKSDLTTIEEFSGSISGYTNESYIPIIRFPAKRDYETTLKRDSILGLMNNLLVAQIGLKGSLRTGALYLIDEAINNIVDHSGETYGYIFSHCNKNNGYVDICIGDSGIGILGSYTKAGKNINTNADAIISAANGISVKNRPEAEGRGFGISTSVDMLVNGLNGKYFLMSGNAFLIKNNREEVISSINKSLSYNGALAALRIPCNTNANFTPSDFYG